VFASYLARDSFARTNYTRENALYRIKKHANRNHYLHVGDNLWVRNPGIAGVPYTDLNQLTGPSDYPVMLQNEMVNERMKYPWVDSEILRSEKAVIISDGSQFAEQHELIAGLPKDVDIFAVNGALINWKSKKRNPSFYVINNPYAQALHYLPKTNFVKCIASTRTNYEFLQRYNGNKYRYCPTNDNRYCGIDSKDCMYRVDDYRNPICAAINLLYRFGVKKLAIVFCDEVFADERPGSILGENGKSYYPQHLTANNLIDGNLYWLKKNNGCKVVQNTVGPKLKAATYIPVEDMAQFFQGK
jgi:hypothetical protein